MKRTVLVATLATLCASLAVWAGYAVRPDFPLHAVPSAGTELSIRVLAEIDGDPATFTAEEQRKFSVLEQVLGAAPINPTLSDLQTQPQFGS